MDAPDKDPISPVIAPLKTSDAPTLFDYVMRNRLFLRALEPFRPDAYSIIEEQVPVIRPGRPGGDRPHPWIATWARALAGVALLFAVGCGDNVPAPPACAEQPFTTESGVRYRDLKCGSGALPERGWILTAKYTGTLANGEQFDSSLSIPEPFRFSLGSGQNIPGWDEGVVGMRVGGIRRLVIPPELAYGDDGLPPRVPPGATLIYRIELLEARAP
ncbi:MAG: FKBP-type peptidyl-prolyl cis-trans isomerase [Actinomycetota bacterium]|nr:FKBP-type peptidyl-prolyl cis-trans isomerase [Actinomycetota bacterium]